MKFEYDERFAKTWFFAALIFCLFALLKAAIGQEKI